MKIAICKIGANITFGSNNSSAANADILYFLRTLNMDECEVTICSHRTRNTVIPKSLKFQEIQNLKSFMNFDVVCVFNGSINFFGGACDDNLLALYSAMNKCETPIAYINTDGQLMMQQLWPHIYKRDWAQHLNDYDYHIEPERVTYVTQGYDIEKVQKQIDSKPNNLKTKKVMFYPLASMILSKSEKFYPRPKVLEPTYDIAFGGATRNTYKRKRIEHYYNHPISSNLLFGNLRGVHCPNATMLGKVSYQQFIPMMRKAQGTVIVADEFYENNFVTLRVFECILAGIEVFIDRRMDTNHQIYTDDYMYVDTPEEVHAKLGTTEAKNQKQQLEMACREGYALDKHTSWIMSILDNIACDSELIPR